MNKVKRALKVFSSRNLMRKFPRESLSLFKELALEPNMVTAQDIMSFAEQFEFDDVWIFHGIAMKFKEKAIVLSGLPGIGKSTLLRKIARTGMAEPIDDGFILVGRANSCYYVLESGLYPTLRTISILAKWLRKLFWYQSPYLNTDRYHNMVYAIKGGEVLHNLAVLIASIVTKNRGSERVISSPVRLVKLILVTHHNDPHPPRRISGGTIQSLNAGDAGKLFKNYASCEVIYCHEEGLREIILDMILTESKS